MKKSKIILSLRISALIIGLVLTVILPPWNVVWARILPLPDTIQEQVEDALDHDFDGIIVYVNQAGHAPAFYAAGWHDRDNKIAANPKALFKIASISKLYNAVAIAKLVNEDRLSLDKSLADYFPELVGRIENAESISLRMMVQHRSGIPNFTDTPDFWADPPETGQECLELIYDMPASFKPGEDYEYCNTNYLLISLLIEKVVGYNHQQYIKEEILIPNELNNTFASIHEVEMNDLMGGYYKGIDHDIKTADYGSIVATAEDVGLFVRALNNGSLFEGREQEIYSSIYVYEHTGLIPGYQSIARYHKDIDAVVVQFVNTTDLSDYTHWGLSEAVYDRIIRILRSQKSE